MSADGAAAADIIELGSSDDEPEPRQQQRPKPKKRPVNAMVSIPGAALPGMMIKRQIQSPGQPAGQRKPSVTPQVQGMLKNPFANKNLEMLKKKRVGNGTPGQIQILPKQSLKIKQAPNKVNIPHNVADIVKNIRAKFVQGIPIQPGVKPQVAFQSVTVPGMPVKNAPYLKSPKVISGPIVAKSLSQLQVVQLNKKPVQGQKCLNNLPPGITVTRTTGQPKRKRERRAVSPANVVIKKQKHDSTAAVLTVELDDDETEPNCSTSSPQWYLQPDHGRTPKDHQSPGTSMEVENNKEPEQKRPMVEITIEDSPIKPPLNKQTAKIAGQLPIIIEDSPKKPEGILTDDKKDDISDKEQSSEVTMTPKSRKKLNYTTESNEKIEIEVEFCTPVQIPIELASPLHEKYLEPSLKTSKDLNKQNEDKSEDEPQKESTQTLKTKEIEQPIQENTSPKQDNTLDHGPSLKKQDSPKAVKVKEVSQTQTPESPKSVKEQSSKCKESKSPKTDQSKKEDSQKFVKSIELLKPVKVPESKPKSSEPFTEMYQEFIDVCFELENTEDMKKIVEKKVKEYYRQVDKSYTESEDFTDMVSDKIKAMRLNPENMYLYIKDIVDELKIRRKSAKGKPSINENMKEISDEAAEEAAEESDGADRPNRNIRKLEKTLRKLHRAIQKLEEQEVDFDDDTDSVYLLTESKDGNSSQPKEKTPESDRQIQIKRYKARLVRVHAKLCQITGTKMPSESKVKLETRPGRPPGPTLRLEKWINKKVPVGAPLPFPDFHDVLRCVKEANDEDKLSWSEMEIKEEARDLFARCGKKLQKRRQENEWRLASSRISAEVDPAEVSTELQQKLADNKKIAAKKEADLIDKYADRQKQLQLEAEEIGDNDAEESAPSSDDDVQMIEETPSKCNTTSTSPLKEINKKERPASPKKETVDQYECTETIPVTTSVTTENLTDSVNNCDLGTETVVIKDKNFNENGEVGNETECSKSNKKSELESESEQLRLVLSDEDSTKGSWAETKGSNSDGQSLLEKVYSENAVSTLESSDTDAHIAISDTLSSDNAQPSAKSGDVVSIENSSESEANTGEPHINIFCSPEKQFLLEIDCSEEENENVKSKMVSDDAMSYENILLGSTEDESNAGESNEETEVNSAQELIQSDIVNSKYSTAGPEMLEDIKSGDKCLVLETKSDSKEIKDCSETNLNGDQVKSTHDYLGTESGNSQQNDPLHNENEDKNEEPFNLDTENSNSLTFSPNENVFTDQNSDIAMDIGPTLIEGGSVDTENSNSQPTSLKVTNQESNSPNSDVAMDIGPTLIEGGSIDTENSNSQPTSLKETNQESNSQNSDVLMDIGQTLVEGANLDTDNSNLDKINRDEQLLLDVAKSNTPVKATVANAMNYRNVCISMDIGPKITEEGIIDTKDSNSVTLFSEKNRNEMDSTNIKINTCPTVKDGEDLTLSDPESVQSNPAVEESTSEPEVIFNTADITEKASDVNLQAECAMKIGPAVVKNVEREITLAKNNLISSSKLDLNVALAGD